MLSRCGCDSHHKNTLFRHQFQNLIQTLCQTFFEVHQESVDRGLSISSEVVRDNIRQFLRAKFFVPAASFLFYKATRPSLVL